MKELKKAPKKLYVIVLSSAVLFALLSILATCSLFDSNELPVGSSTADWQKTVKNSNWTFSSRNADESSLIPALRTVKAICFSDDFSMIIEYSDDKGNSHSFNSGTVSFSSDSTAVITVRQASDSGYVANEITVSFSNQTDKQFDDKNYIMTLKISSVGSLYFFYRQ